MATGDIVATDIRDIVATDIVATDIVATMVILMEDPTGGGTIAPTTGLITEAFMAPHMVATTTGVIEDSGLAFVTKTEEERMPKRLGV
jgi:hypothetical protein